jgi:hypothetical protein
MTTERLQIADPRMCRISITCDQRVSRTVGEMCYHYQTPRRNHFIMYRYLLVIILKRGVGIAQLVQRRITGLDDTGLIPVSARFLSSQQRPARFWGPLIPPIQWVSGPLSLGVKRQGCESDHSPPYSAKVKNGGAIPPLSHTSSLCGA